jgi:hypothetical protein
VKIIFRALVAVLALAGWAALPGICHAQARCPWLNAATAAGVLGGDVQMAVTAPVDPGAGTGVGAAKYPDQVRIDRFDVSCDFSRKVDSVAYTLSIVVKTMSDPAKDFGPFLAQCAGPTVALKGIGNEAVQCMMKDDAHAGYEQVIARVRDRAFVLTIHREAKTHGAADHNELSDETRNVAEQVAGSLF